MSTHLQSSGFTHIPGSKNSHGRGVFARSDVANTLNTFAHSGNYHKVTLLKMLQGLTAGHDHQDNILQVANPLGRTEWQFLITLPGCMAEVIRHPDGNYYVHNIVVQPEEAMEDHSTGLYRTIKSDGGWQTKPESGFTPSAELEIVITDTNKSSNDAAKTGAKALADTDYTKKATLNSFYLHHTEGKRSSTSYIRRKSITQPLAIAEIRGSSQRLADTMLLARTESQKMPGKPEDRKLIAWVSSDGGSAVLTQALNILKERGISFHGHNHHVFFHNIASDADQAVTLALDLGFKMPAKPFTKRLWSFKSLAVGGSHKAINHRVNAEADYTRAMAGLEHTANVAMPAMGILGAGCVLAGPTLTGVALISVARKAYAGVQLADQMASDAAGKHYEAIKRRVGLIN